ncbi:MAG TPA: ABC transporter permease [Acidimicrobiales bacterium]|jgi:osmoprotectant transport system permease protein
MTAGARPFISWSWIDQNRGQIGSDLAHHLELSFVAVGIGLAIAVPLSVLAWRYAVLRAPLMTISSTLYIIPSLALFVILGPVTGYFSTTTAEIALVGYTLLILCRNTLAGLEAVPGDARDAARAMGYTPTASLLRVELPLAVPYVVAGVRIATVTVIGLVSVTALIGLGGLGQLFVAGLQGSVDGPFYTPIIVGLVLSVVLAALADLALVGLGRVLVPWSRTPARRVRSSRPARALSASGS